MRQNYEVFEDVVDLDKEEDDNRDKQPGISNPAEQVSGYIGNHRILWVKNREIKLTLGPHCIFFPKVPSMVKYFRAFLPVYVWDFIRRRNGLLDLRCPKIQRFHDISHNLDHFHRACNLSPDCLNESWNHSKV